VLTIERSEAMAAALNEVARLEVHPDFVIDGGVTGGWRVMTAVTAAPTEADVFVFDADAHRVHCGPAYSPWGRDASESECEAPPCDSLYAQQMASRFISPPHWSVRLARFDRDTNLSVSERAEELVLGVAEGGEIVWMDHTVPEHHPGSNATEAEAQAAALDLAAMLVPAADGSAATRGRVASQVADAEQEEAAAALKIVSSGPTKRLARLDWTVTFAHGPTLLHPALEQDEEPPEGESRIEVRLVDGRLAGWSKYVHVPEVWSRHERAGRTAVQVLSSGLGILFTLLSMISGLCALAVWGTGWGGSYSSTAFRRTLLGMLALYALNTHNKFAAMEHEFPTAQPWLSTAAQRVALGMFGALSRSLLTALQISLAITIKPQRTDKPDTRALPSWATAGPGVALGLGLTALHYVLAPAWERAHPTWDSTAFLFVVGQLQLPY